MGVVISFPATAISAKRLAVLREAMVDVGVTASHVIDAVTCGRGSSAMVASGSIAISPALCDTLIELFTILSHEREPGDAA
jgi:ABC-type phosphate transport system permease subunit